MTTEDTQVAEPVLDATEPAPSQDETQSVYAWSQEGDDTQIIGRRSWRLPITLAALAVAGLATAGVVTVWPHHSTPKNPAVVAAPPVVAPPAPELAMAPADKKFIDSLKAYGFKINDAKQTADSIAQGRGICQLLSLGEPSDLVIQEMHDEKMPQLSLAQTHIVVDDAIAAYCPQYVG